MAKNQIPIQVGTQENLEEKRGFYWILARPEIALLITLGGVAVALLNLWIISKLAPLSESLAVITQRVEANEMTDKLEHPNFVIHGELLSVVERLDRIESKLDRLIESR